MTGKHDLAKPFQSCPCEAHKRIRRRIRKRASMGQPVRMMVKPIGTVRRLQALACLGYSPRRVVREAGLGQPFASELLAGKYRMINDRSAKAIAEVYDRWCMTPAPRSREATYARRRALQSGWLPPLAWDDIDRPSDQPKGWKRPAA